MCVGAVPKAPTAERPVLPLAAPRLLDQATQLARQRGGIAEQMRRGLLSTYRPQTPALQAPAMIAGKKLFGD
jgi:hypothetical protein